MICSLFLLFYVSIVVVILFRHGQSLIGGRVQTNEYARGTAVYMTNGGGGGGSSSSVLKSQ